MHVRHVKSQVSITSSLCSQAWLLFLTLGESDTGSGMGHTLTAGSKARQYVSQNHGNDTY